MGGPRQASAGKNGSWIAGSKPDQAARPTTVPQSPEWQFSTQCLAVPGKIFDITEQNKLRLARVQFGGIVRRVSLDFVPEATVGDYLVVHVGFTISRIDKPEARRNYEMLEEMGALEGEFPETMEEISGTDNFANSFQQQTS